jgi:endonuclease G
MTMICKTIVLLCVALTGMPLACLARVLPGGGQGLEIPAGGGSKASIVLSYAGFTVSYNQATMEPDWVAYELTAEEAEATTFSRKGVDYCQDPNFRGRQADKSDYRRSGWTRGHMVPAGDMRWSATAMQQSFYFTNICPQTEKLNNGSWGGLEESCRKWAKRYGRVWIVCGPIFTKPLSTIGSGVYVPSYFFKVVLVPVAGGYSGAGFIYRNDSSQQQREALTIDDVERVTGFDFFPELPDGVERQVESRVEGRMW